MILPIVWTPELAYAIGLITTDGNLSKDGRHIDFTSKDIDQIQTFLKILNLKTKIGLKSSGTSDKEYYRTQFGNIKFYRFLLSIGLTPAKSKTLGELKIPDEYFADFLRGHLDGDGSIFTYQDKYNEYRGHAYVNTRIYIYFLSVSKAHIEWLSNKILALTGIKGSIQKNIPKNKNHSTMWTIKIAKKESIRLLHWIYYKSDLPTLQRKYDIAKQVLELISKEKRKKYTKVKIEFDNLVII